ncbi:MAG: hypothetical protein FJ315_06870 [SAR202 cluster bacterium]|nr:hypothetical protein [SAR202 cluster bacterium]
MVRDVFQANYGKGDELVALMKGFYAQAEKLGMNIPHRLFTDASGQFFTVVTEDEFASLGDWEKSFQQLMSDPSCGSWFAKMVPLVESGRREYYNVVPAGNSRSASPARRASLKAVPGQRACRCRSTVT